MTLVRYKVDLSGFSGAPGLNVWHFERSTAPDAGVLGPALRTFYDATKAYLAAGVTVSVPNVAEVIDEDTGELTGYIPQGSNNSTVTGTGAGGLSRATQAKIQARTNVVRGGRLIQGGIFFGPIGEAAVTTGGEITSACSTALTTAGNILIAAVGLDGTSWAIYSRPFAGSETRPARSGFAASVASVSVWNIPGVQRDRRI